MKARMRVTNNWEALEFFWDDRQIDPRMIRGCRLKWPDGTESEEKIECRERRGTYGDMGHEYDFVTLDLIIKIKHKGFGMEIDIRSLAHRVIKLREVKR